MTNEIIISGFGGQGVMAIGKTLCEAGMKEGKNVSWLPSYGPEMRGGTANCCVVLSDEPIVSPIVLEPTELIAMNLPSLLKFEPSVVENGTVFVNRSMSPAWRSHRSSATSRSPTWSCSALTWRP